MKRLIAALAFVFQPLAAFALCEASDMIDALPEAERTQLEANVAAMPYAEGVLWRASRGDTRITLFGTYHFQHQLTETHLDRLKPIVDDASVVFLEMSHDDQQNFQTTIANDPSLMFITEGPTLPDLLGEDWAQFSDEMRKRQIPGIMAAKFKPLWAAMMLGIGPCEAQNGAMAGEGIDAMVGAYADASGVPTRSLEDFTEVLTWLDKEPLEKQLDMIRLTLAWPGDADDMSFTIRERYLAEQIGLTWEYSRAVSIEYGGPSGEEDFARLETALLTERNRAWVDLLLAEAEGQTVLVAAGAGHLPGEAGVLRLLQNEGFTIGRLSLIR